MIRICKIKINEIAKVKRLLKLIWKDTYKNLLSEKDIKNVIGKWHNTKFLKSQLADKSVLFIVAKIESGKIVGLATLEKKDETKIHLGRLYVHPNHQRQGIGNMLFKYILKKLPQAKKVQLGVIKNNGKAIKFYQKHGFKQLKIIHEKIKDTSLDIILMEKTIS